MDGSHSTANKDQANWTWWLRPWLWPWKGEAQLSSHHITSPDTIKFVKEAGERSQKKEKIKEEKKVFCKKALLQKAKRDRLVKKLKLEGEL